MRRYAILVLMVGACSGGGGTTDPPVEQFGTVRGRALLTNDDPLAGVGISLQRSGAASRSATTDAGGNFQVGNLSTGAWTVTATPPTGYEGQGSLTATAQVAANQTVDVPPFRLRQVQQQPPPTQVAVSMTDNAFTPNSVTVAVGGTVTWTNNGTQVHNSTGPDWASGNLNPTQQYARTFPAAGTFSYSCTLHAGMNGTVVVQ